MNRRQLFGWLVALPFVPAALAAAEPIIRRIKGYQPIDLSPYVKAWDDAFFAEYLRSNELHKHLLEGYQWTPAEQEVLKNRARVFMQRGDYSGLSFNTISGSPNIDMKYRPNLPEWF